MNSIDLTKVNNIVIGSTSRGTQKKWLYKDYWYKEDFLGYEALAECIASRILEQSNIKSFVHYDPIRIKCGDKIRTGCASRNFKKANDNIIPLQKLYRLYEGGDLSKTLSKISDVSDRVKCVSNFIEDKLALKNFEKYLTAMLEFDGLILNEDRHLNNISVIISDTGKAKLCPVFDNGISLLSDMISYPLGDDIYGIISRLEAKPFSRNFIEQIDAAEALYKPQLTINPCRGMIAKWMDEMSEYYDDAVLQRAETVIREQFRVWNIR